MSLVPPQDRTQPVRMDSPVALFVPTHRIEPPVPAPLYLLEFVPGSMKQAYRTGPGGLVLDQDDSYQERVVVSPDGSRCRVEVQGSQSLGLPTQYDTDYLLALFRIADQGGIEPDGTLLDPSYRSVLRAAGRDPNTRSSDDIQSVKRALARWGSVVVATHLELNVQRAAEIQNGTSHPLVPGGYPRMLRSEQRHHILNYEVRREEYQGRESDSIQLLRINPIWLDQAAAGISAWVDVDTHNRLKSAWAKRLYQILAIRAARGWRVRTSWMVPMEELLAEMGVSNSLKPGRNAQNLAKALELLEDAGVIARSEVAQVGHGKYEVGILAGELLLSAGHLRGVGGADPVLTRTLLWHLARFGIAASVGRDLLRTHAAQVQTALQYAYFLQSERDGRESGKPVVNWGGWLISKVETGWRFDDPEFERWLQRITSRLDGPADAPAVKPLPKPSETSKQEEHPEPPAPMELPDDVWGQVLSAIRSEISDSAFRSWLYGTQLAWTEPDQAVVIASSGFAASWIDAHYSERLRDLLAEKLGRNLALRVDAEAPAPETDRESE